MTMFSNKKLATLLDNKDVDSYIDEKLTNINNKYVRHNNKHRETQNQQNS